MRRHVSYSVLLLCLSPFPIVTIESPHANSATQVHTNSLSRNAVLSRIEASIMGESALVDKETGRIFWEGGSSSTVSESINPHIRKFGGNHFKATLLSCFLWTSIVGEIARLLTQKLDQKMSPPGSTERGFGFYVLLLTYWVVKYFPKFDRWFQCAVFLLYVIEAWTCSTRRYLANSISSPEGVEEYIENLRSEEPRVQWKLRSFHYESLSTRLARWGSTVWQRHRKKEASPHLTALNRRRPSSSDFRVPISSGIKAKRITDEKSAFYNYTKFSDQTTAGMWKRATATSSSPAPFTKILLSKILVLSDGKARADYFRQQSEFVVAHGQSDDHAEFSTRIIIAGFRPRMLAVRSGDDVQSAKLFSTRMFCLFSLLGLTVPYRIWFSSHCDELRVTVVKETSATKPSSQSWLSSWVSSKKEESEEEKFSPFMRDMKLYREKSTISSSENATAVDGNDTSLSDDTILDVATSLSLAEAMNLTDAENETSTKEEQELSNTEPANDANVTKISDELD